MIPNFDAMPKIPRWSRDLIITEKIDGTNASIYIDENGPLQCESGRVVPFLVGSRTRWIFPENDNYGFAKWAYTHEDLIKRLGPGHHFGEWWGCGIQRGYGLKEKRFSLFNVGRWTSEKIAELNGDQETPFFRAVPILYEGPNDPDVMTYVMSGLEEKGSAAAPGFMNPEGIVIYHKAGGYIFKKTFDKDEGGKSNS